MPSEHDPPEISVVVPTYNAEATLAETLTALAEGSKVPEHVIVVDNNSTDASAAVAERFRHRFANFSVVPCPVQGVNAARNVGLAAATTSHVMFADADDRVESDWFELISEALPWHALVCTLRHAKVVDGVWQATEPDALGVIPHDFLPQVCGAASGVAVDVWDDVGRFDESYERGSDDTEFFWRVMLAGYRVTELPEAVVWYRLRPTLRSVWRQRWRHGVTGARLWRQYREQGWDVHFRRHQFRNILSATKAVGRREIGFWEWYARFVAASGSIYAASRPDDEVTATRSAGPGEPT
jgi:glycosyltransferase involved in cell wall biosynthesis